MVEGSVRIIACPFCDIIDGRADADNIVHFPRAIAFRPLNPVTPGHMLVVPRAHIAHAADDPYVAGYVMEAAAMYAREHYESANIITSINEAATQTVYHLHLHVVPRRFGDGLVLPWSNA